MSIWNKKLNFAGASGGLECFRVDNELGIVFAYAFRWDHEPFPQIYMRAAAVVHANNVSIRRDQMLVEANEISLEFLIENMEGVLRDRGYSLTIIEEPCARSIESSC